MGTEKVCDLWWHPLLSELHAAVTKGAYYLSQPMEFVLPGRHGLRHVRQGLACFHITKDGPRTLPSFHTPIAPLLQLAPVNSPVIDLPLDKLPALMFGASHPCFLGLTCRSPTKSLGCTEGYRRVTIEVLFPGIWADVSDDLMIRSLRCTL